MDLVLRHVGCGVGLLRPWWRHHRHHHLRQQGRPRRRLATAALAAAALAAAALAALTALTTAAAATAVRLPQSSNYVNRQVPHTHATANAIARAPPSRSKPPPGQPAVSSSVATAALAAQRPGDDDACSQSKPSWGRPLRGQRKVLYWLVGRGHEVLPRHTASAPSRLLSRRPPAPTAPTARPRLRRQKLPRQRLRLRPRLRQRQRPRPAPRQRPGLRRRLRQRLRPHRRPRLRQRQRPRLRRPKLPQQRQRQRSQRPRPSAPTTTAACSPSQRGAPDTSAPAAHSTASHGQRT